MYASKTVGEIMSGLETAFLHCQTISEGHACDKCPLVPFCLEETDYATLATDVPRSAWEEFIEFADDVHNYVSDEDMRAYFDDMTSKAERDEYYD